jgi:hypothetical protein
MLMFLAILGVSVAAVLLVQAMDIECERAAKPRRNAGRSHVVKAGATYPEGAAFSGLQ